MTRPTHRATILIAILLGTTLLSCAAPPAGSNKGAAPDSTERPTSAGPKRIVIAIAGDLPVLNSKVIRSVFAYTSPGGSEVEDLITDGLSDLDGDDLPQAKLAEAVPTLENGLWKLLPDGRMETSWKIRENARWHDGTAFTTDDLLFTMTVGRDRELPLFRDANFRLIDDVQASDSRTITVTWSQPFIQADTLFSKDLAQPLPKHILEAPYLSDKAGFAQLPHWSSEFVGTGPFKLKTFTLGSSVVLSAFDDYVLGRPKLDEIEVRFIPDANTLMANLYSGAVDATMGRGITLDHALQAKDTWTAGQPVLSSASWVAIFPQFVDPTPAAIADVRIRRALMHALDRQQIVDTIQSGVTPVAHSFINPSYPDFPQGDDVVVRYDYDPRRAAQLIEEAGFIRAADGLYRDGAGQRFSAEIWASGESKQMIATADGWRQVGVEAEPVVLPQQRWNDREYVAKFPAFRMNRQPNSIAELRRYQSAQAPLPENSFVGANYSRYRSPDLDQLIDRYFTTIPKGERSQLLGQIVHHMTENVVVMGLYYDVQPMLVSNRIVNMSGPATGWNAHLWDVR